MDARSSVLTVITPTVGRPGLERLVRSLDSQTLGPRIYHIVLWDDQRCPHMIQVRLKRAKREALALSFPPPGGGPAIPKNLRLRSLIQRTSGNLQMSKLRAVADALRRRLS